MQFQLPDLGEGIHEGELLKWRVKVGQQVQHDDPLCEVLTDKASIEIPSPFAGKILALQAVEGARVKVGEILLEATSSETTSTNPGKEAASLPAVVPSPTPLASTACSLRSASLSSDVLASPAVRREAREKGVDLKQIPGSGPAGRILKSDFESFLNQVPTSHPPAKAPQVIPFRGLRKKIAEKMRLSKQQAAHFTYVEEADVSALVALRREAKAWAAEQGVKLTYLPFVMKAMVQALKKYPILNATLDEVKEEIVCHSVYHIGLSIQTEDGLMAPVVRSVDQKSIFQLAKEIQDLVERARTKRLTREDFQGSTITLTNVGSIGGLFTTPILNYPEVAIVGLNKIFRKPVVVQEGGVEKIQIRDWTYFSISLDHRVVDGAIAAEFMQILIQSLEQPFRLLLNP